jgi:hypothetical protein
MDHSANFFFDLFVGLSSLVGVSGVGRLAMRPFRPVALHWYIALSMLAGFALSSVSIQCLAMVGSGPTGFRILGAGILVLGLAGHWIGRSRYSSLPLIRARRLRIFAISFMCLVLAVPALISLAPSTKSDEIYYHMLVGRRVLEDHSLRVYQRPFEQAIIPQMGYQIAETVFHATNTPDAGNILSLGFGIALWILMYGVVTEETGRAEWGLFASLVCAIGIYPAAMYVTAGPHALGDLAMFAAVAALFFPGSLSASADNTDDLIRSLACALGAVCAASTKISLLPLAVLITAAAPIGLSGTARMKKFAIAVGLWLLVLGPLVTWTTIHTGSPFGAAFARFFGHTVYQPATLEDMEMARDQTGWLEVLRGAVEFLNGANLLLILFGAVTCCRRWKRLAGLLFLVVLQMVLIARFLPHEFRFLGGLQYGLLAAGAVGLSQTWRGRVPLKWVAVASLLLLGPWLAAELYYARPFAAVALGITTREDFLERHVAFIDDFQALDKILPRDATLYISAARAPAIYAPRPVIFSLADWDRRTPLYWLLAQPFGKTLSDSELEAAAGTTCKVEVYRNPDAVIVAYRTPNRKPDRGVVIVRRCFAN